MDLTRLCIDTGPLIAFLKGRNPGAASIAAICLEHKLPLLTLNQQHFGRVPNLTVVTPAEIAS